MAAGRARPTVRRRKNHGRRERFRKVVLRVIRDFRREREIPLADAEVMTLAYRIERYAFDEGGARTPSTVGQAPPVADRP